jgi:hypothetical protein
MSKLERKRLSHPNLVQVSSLCSDIQEFLKQCTGIMGSVRLQENYVALGCQPPNSRLQMVVGGWTDPDRRLLVCALVVVDYQCVLRSDIHSPQTDVFFFFR